MTVTPSETATPTATPTNIATDTPTATPTATPLTVVLIPCPADCDRSRTTTLDELLRCVNITLRQAPPDLCEACDANVDGWVGIDDLVSSVGALLNGCSELRWYRGCGPRVPGKQTCPEAVVACTTEDVGSLCNEPGAECCEQGSMCAGGECNRPLLCTDDDPRNPPGSDCRHFSSQRFEQDIE